MGPRGGCDGHCDSEQVFVVGALRVVGPSLGLPSGPLQALGSSVPPASARGDEGRDRPSHGA